MKKLPLYFKPLFWSHNFSKIDADQEANGVILTTINHGNWRHWQWVLSYYGENKIKNVIKNTPRSEFRTGAFRLATLLFNIKKTKYALRGDKIKAKSNI